VNRARSSEKLASWLTGPQSSYPQSLSERQGPEGVFPSLRGEENTQVAAHISRCHRLFLELIFTAAEARIEQNDHAANDLSA
jgi:hypothetical protein